MAPVLRSTLPAINPTALCTKLDGLSPPSATTGCDSEPVSPQMGAESTPVTGLTGINPALVNGGGKTLGAFNFGTQHAPDVLSPSPSLSPVQQSSQGSDGSSPPSMSSSPPSSPSSPRPVRAGSPLPCPSRGKSHSRKKAPGHVPRARNAFILFRSDFVRRKNIPPSVLKDQGGLSKVAGFMWRKLPPADKDHYGRMAKAEKKMHAAMYPKYKYKPSADTERKKRTGEHRSKGRVPEEEAECARLAELCIQGVVGEALEKTYKAETNGWTNAKPSLRASPAASSVSSNSSSSGSSSSSTSSIVSAESPVAATPSGGRRSNKAEFVHDSRSAGAGQSTTTKRTRAAPRARAVARAPTQHVPIIVDASVPTVQTPDRQAFDRSSHTAVGYYPDLIPSTSMSALPTTLRYPETSSFSPAAYYDAFANGPPNSFSTLSIASAPTPVYGYTANHSGSFNYAGDCTDGHDSLDEFFDFEKFGECS